jgi:hypothetical protein
MKIQFSSFWFWAIDIVTILSLIAFLTGTGDIFDLSFFFFVVLPRVRNFSKIDNGLIGYIRQNLADITFDEEE